MLKRMASLFSATCAISLAVTACSGAGGATPKSPQTDWREIPLTGHSFGQVDANGNPSGWQVFPVRGIDAGYQPDSAPLDGTRVLALRSDPGDITVAYAPIPAEIVTPGATIRVIALARVKDGNSLFLAINGMADGNDYELAASAWPPCQDEWTRLATDWVVTDGYAPDTIRVSIRYRNSSDARALVDDVRVLVR